MVFFKSSCVHENLCLCCYEHLHMYTLSDEIALDLAEWITVVNCFLPFSRTTCFHDDVISSVLPLLKIFCTFKLENTYFPSFHFSSPAAPLHSFFSASSLAAVPCWVESNLNYASQGPISLLPAVGISGLLISYQAVIGLRSPRPSDIPQIYDTPDRLRGGWGGGGLIGGGGGSSRLPTLYSTKCLPDRRGANSRKGIFSIRATKDYSIVQKKKKKKTCCQCEVRRDLMPCANCGRPFLPFSHRNKL